MYKYSLNKGWEIISNKFVAEDIEDEVFHFGFYKSDIKFKIDSDDLFELTLFVNHKNIMEEKFLLHLRFYEDIYEILVSDLPDLIVLLKDIRTSLLWK
jgi:hypothetical protein